MSLPQNAFDNELANVENAARIMMVSFFPNVHWLLSFVFVYSLSWNLESSMV